MAGLIRHGAVFFLILLVMPVWAHEEGGTEENPFSVYYDEGPVSVAPGQVRDFQVIFQIPDGHYVYKDSIAIRVEQTEGIVPGKLELPVSEQKEDPFLNRSVAIYHGEMVATLKITMPGTAWAGPLKLSGVIQYQGCSSELCYRLMKIPFEATFIVPGQGVVQISDPHPPKPSLWEKIKSIVDASDFTKVAERGIWLAMLIAFIGGVLTDFTPCVLPMVPVTLAVIGVRKDQTHTHNFIAVGVMVLGMAVTYSALGVSAALVGKSLGFLFQSPFFLVLLILILGALALSLLGLYEIQLPPAVQYRLAHVSSSGYRGIFLIGLTMGLMAAPCVGPVMGPLLVYVAKTGSITLGFLLLMSYALGMGSLFLIIGGFYGSLKMRIKAGAWTNWFKKGLGVLILLVAAYYGHVLYSGLKAHQKLADSFWIESLAEGDLQQRALHKPMLVDFFAESCLPCLELDRKVWSDPAVRGRLEKNWIPVKIDCTRETDICREATTRFQVVGWPTVVFLAADGAEDNKIRLVGKVISAEEMLSRLKHVDNLP